MHAINAPLALDRMIDGFPADRQPLIRIQLASCLVGIVSQLLLPRADQIGRCLVSEVLRATEAVRSIIRDGRAERLTSVMQLGGSHGMHTLDESLTHLLKHGYITYEDAMAYGRDREYIQNEYTNHMRHLQKKAQAVKK
jgi:twitching motility protein PilT